MNEEELQAKAEALEAKEKELAEKEEALAKREADAQAKEEDAAHIGASIKTEYEARIAKEKAEFEKRLAEREDVIKQLARGETQNEPTPTAVDKLNERRRLQRHF